MFSYVFERKGESAAMEFSEFAQKMHNVLGGVGIGTFTRTLLSKIINVPLDISDDVNPLIKQSDESFKSYYVGTNGIRRFSNSVRLWIRENEFENYVDGLTDGVKNDLYKEFASVCPGITEKNVAKVLSLFFKDILTDAMKRKNSKKERILQVEARTNIFVYRKLQGFLMSLHPQKNFFRC